MSDFDLAGTFDEDYLYFYDHTLTPERSDRETGVIVSLLGLPAGAAVLDAPCGHGRIANRLAARGFKITGIDITELFLQRARKDAADLGVDVEYVHGDLRALSFESRFDAVVNWFTSFGYFGEEQDKAILRGFRRALRPGGKLLIEHQARDRIVSSLPPSGMPPRVIMEEVGDDLLIDKVDIDIASGTNRAERIIVRSGTVRRTRFTVRMFTVPEITSWLHEAGFSDVRAFGAEGEPFGRTSARMIVIAR